MILLDNVFALDIYCFVEIFELFVATVDVKLFNRSVTPNLKNSKVVELGNKIASANSFSVLTLLAHHLQQLLL